VWRFAKDDEGARRVIVGGLANKAMPGFGAALKPAQITALIQYIRENQSTAPEPALRSFPKRQSTNSKQRTNPLSCEVGHGGVRLRNGTEAGAKLPPGPNTTRGFPQGHFLHS